ncbi:transposase [Streptomyces sp. NPDC058914]|uniref:transposase n=1 Tax=Streptomyces sp. NPDC058914 TaxID=3346671 RepID=UPI003674A614
MPAGRDPASPEAHAADVARRGRCGIPAQAGHVEKCQPALDVINGARSWGVDVPLIVADAGHDDAARDPRGPEERDLPYTVGISGRHGAHPGDARPVQPDSAGTGRPPNIRTPTSRRP